MIRVDPKPEPATFNARVRTRGRAYLRVIPHPTSKQFRSHDYWVEVLEELHTAYNGICAYSCHWIPYDTGADTVEHFLPKDTYPDLAYEWTNYRLVCQTLNGRKWTYENVLDPFTIQTGWFWIDFPSLLVRPADGLDPALTAQILDTRDRLGLNDEGTCVKSRARYVKDYCVNGLPFGLLERDAPYLASEIIRQGLRETLSDVMRY